MTNSRNIKYTNKFKRLYKKLTNPLKEKTKDTISKLKYNPFPDSLKVHKLSGKLEGYFSCSIDYKHRIVFEIEKDGDILLILVGNHEIYR